MSDGFDQLCARLEKIDLFGKAGAPLPANLADAVREGAAVLPHVYQSTYVSPLEKVLPRLVRQASHGDTTTLETITAAAYQHSANDPLRPPLHRFLAVISDLYRSFLSLEKRANLGLPLAETLPPLAMFQNDGSNGPFTIPVDDIAQLIGGAVGVVSMPATYANDPIIWAALAHETGGHDVTHADPGLLDELAGGLSAAFAALPSDPSVSREDLTTLWSYWIDEAAADVYGLLNVGPAFAPNLAAFFVALNQQAGGIAALRMESGYSGDDPSRILDPHPTDILRLHLAAGVIDALSGLSPATLNAYVDQITRLATTLATSKTVTIVGNIPLSGANQLQWTELQVPLAHMQQAARCVGAYIATARLTTLDGHSIQEIETWDDHDEAAAQAIRDALANGRPIVGLGDDAQLLAGATLALLDNPALYDAVQQALNDALDQSYRTDPIWGVPQADRIYIRYAEVDQAVRPKTIFEPSTFA